MNKIIITKRSDDYHAALENTGAWGNGETIDAAIGDLIRTHPLRFDIEIELRCKKCGTPLKKGLCQDETCPYSDRKQNGEFTIG